MEYISHKLIKPESMQSRLYQEAIFATAIKENTLCVLPTGLGKTNIAVMLTAHILDEKPDSKVLFLAPTRPLVQQHYKSFTKFIDLPASEMEIVIGTIAPSERQGLYEKRIIFATPQTIANDLENKRFSLAGFGLLIIDEIHHAVGKYAYPRIAEIFLKDSNGRILGLTASPGEDRKKIGEICRNCGIERVEIRTEESEDVAPYVKEKKVEWINVDLPKRFDKVRELLKQAYAKRLEQLKKQGFLRTGMVSKKMLLKLQADLSSKIKQGNKRAFIGISFTAQAIKIEHAIGLLETQGISMLENYWKRMRSGTNSDMRLAKDANISAAMLITREFFEEGVRHPKIGRLCSLVTEQIREKPGSKIIIFANYRDSVKEIASVLSKLDNISPVEFVGQREGMTQKEQAKRLDDFRSGRYNILICTSVGEEGIDIPAMDLAIFYEPVPSAIRSIQRRGRVGRTDVGKIVILITKDTRDEAYYWVAKSKEKRMHKTIYGMKHGLGSIVENG